MSSTADERERRVLFVRYRQTRDRELRNRLIELNAPLAETIARRYAGRGIAREDLSQVALLGLLKAVERFEPERGLAFSSFATPTIEGELKRHFRDERWTVHVPRRLQEVNLEVNASVADLSQRRGHAPTVREIAADTGLSEETVLEGLEAGRAAAPAPLDAGTHDDERPGPVDRMGVTDARLEHVEQRLVLSHLLAALPDRERQLMALRFLDGLTQSQIAERFGISQMQVSRLLARSLERLRAIAGTSAHHSAD